MGRTFFCLVFLCIHLEKFKSFGNNVCETKTRCMTSRIHGMKSVDCYHRDFGTFPECIPSDAEVLDLSFNRIRKLNKSDLSKFRQLKLLYLNENFFSNLPNDTFEGMDTLISLDLSQNNLKLLPTSVFTLPALNKIFVRQNSELNMTASVGRVRPILSPISVIDMSSTTETNSISEFPDFGPMPYLVSINISENWFPVLSPKHFAGLCNLKTLINTNVTNNYKDGCDCWIINRWLLERHVQFEKFPCSISENECQNRELTEEDKSSYNECLQIAQAIQQRQRILKICIGTGVSALILIILILVYFYFAKCKKRLANNNVKSAPSKGPLLLNNHLNTNL